MTLLTKTFLTLAGGLLLITVPGRADTFIINDLTDALSFTHDGSNDAVSGSCLLESCSIDVFSNDGFFEPPPTARNVLIGEPGGVDISDQISILPGTGMYAIVFLSDADPNIFPTCAEVPGGCSIIEDGSVQTAETVTLTNLSTGATRTDTIQFASDVPEPASLLLLGTGLLGVAGAIRRKWLG